MFHRATNLKFLEGTTLELTFQDGKVISYDVAKLFDKHPSLQALRNRDLFISARMTPYGIIWNDELDLSAETIYENGDLVQKNEPEINEKIAIIVKNARSEAGISQQELSRLTGIDQADISKIECGFANPSVSTLNRLARALGKNLKITLD